jgi:hypothetical protein
MHGRALAILATIVDHLRASLAAAGICVAFLVTIGDQIETVTASIVGLGEMTLHELVCQRTFTIHTQESRRDTGLKTLTLSESEIATMQPEIGIERCGN